ncbi:hypothetical protein BpHYR1_009697 [Brachionus plicatilis]|uniref:Uncharacterized protein n=1 Tax=Brachionus plicatilis TaxID=10195 RepID=A0A3M7QM67_BRAPC|nr:hypothetical protein BpHYR1_009697 [Brachionus plicatilis]
MTEITTSHETLNVVKTALSKHANPVPCDLCGELMKNIKDPVLLFLIGEMSLFLNLSHLLKKKLNFFAKNIIYSSKF